MLTDALTKVEIGPYRDTDREGVAALIIPIQREEMGVDLTLEDQPDLTIIPEFYSGGASGFWCARHGGRVVGTIALKDFGEGAALRKMFVDARFRGTPHYLAAKLLDIATAHARLNGASGIWLGTINHFHAARRFYAKHGFSEYALSDVPAAYPYMAPDDVFCGKLLT